MISWEVKTEPIFSIKNLIGGFCVAIGLLIFLIIFHIMTINETGNTQIVMVSTFNILLYVFEFILLMAILYIIYQLFRWMVWIVQVPKWRRMEMRQEKIR